MRLWANIGGFLHRMPRIALLVLLALGIFATLDPLSPVLPDFGLDPSWMLGLNQAVGQGLVFGKDIVFTYGPYASLVTHAYHPATDHLMLYGGVLLGFCYVLVLLLLVQGTAPRWILAFLVFALGCLASTDPLYASYPLLLALLCFRINLPDGTSRKIRLNNWERVLLPLLFLPLGLLVLTKATFLFTCALLTLLCSSLFWRCSERYLAAACVCLPVVSVPVFWVLCGQPLSGLAGFFLALGPIVSGYSQAMVRYGRDGHVQNFIFFLIAAFYLLRWIRGRPGLRSTHTLFLTAAFAVYLFFGFKAGFVRHDTHAVIAGDVLMLALLLGVFAVEEAPAAGVVMLCMLVWWACDEYAVGTSTRSIYHNMATTYRDFGKGLRARWHDPQALPEKYREGLVSIQRQHPFPRHAGTMDVYPFDQAYVFSAGNSWSPRPVFQSYSAYTPELLELNAAHLQGAHAPDNILFRIDTMNNRLPALEDGLSWPLLINNYSMQGFENGFIYLQKRTVPTAFSAHTAVTGEFHLGDEVNVPTGISPVFASIDIRSSLYGTLEATLFRQSQLQISVQLADGRTLDYGFVPGMAKTGFLLSPLIEDTAGFCHLAAGDLGGLAGNRVVRFRIYAPRLGRLSWRAHFTIKWLQQDLTHDAASGILQGCSSRLPSVADTEADAADKDKKE